MKLNPEQLADVAIFHAFQAMNAVEQSAQLMNANQQLGQQIQALTKEVEHHKAQTADALARIDALHALDAQIPPAPKPVPPMFPEISIVEAMRSKSDMVPADTTPNGPMVDAVDDDGGPF